MKILFILFFILFNYNLIYSDFIYTEQKKNMKLYYIFFENNFFHDIYDIIDNNNSILKVMYEYFYSKQFYFNNNLDDENLKILLKDMKIFKPNYVVIFDDIIFDYIKKNNINDDYKIIYFSFNLEDCNQKDKNIYKICNYFDSKIFLDFISTYSTNFESLNFLCDNTRICFLKYKLFINILEQNKELKKLKVNFFKFKNIEDYKKFLMDENNRSIKNGIIVNSVDFLIKDKNDFIKDKYIDIMLYNNIKNNNLFICFKEHPCKNSITFRYSLKNIYSIISIIADNYYDNIKINPDILYYE